MDDERHQQKVMECQTKKNNRFQNDKYFFFHPSQWQLKEEQYKSDIESKPVMYNGMVAANIVLKLVYARLPPQQCYVYHNMRVALNEMRCRTMSVSYIYHLLL